MEEQSCVSECLNFPSAYGYQKYVENVTANSDVPMIK
jgi:hypothetical protein